MRERERKRERRGEDTRSLAQNDKGPSKASQATKSKPSGEINSGDRLRVGEVSRGEKMTLRGIDPESYITEYTLVYEDYLLGVRHGPDGSVLDAVLVQ